MTARGWVAVDFSREACEARRKWWAAGAPGHWPGCPCAAHHKHPETCSSPPTPTPEGSTDATSD